MSSAPSTAVLLGHMISDGCSLCAVRITLRTELIGRGPNAALMFCAIADGLKPLAEVQSASVPQP